MLVTLKRGSKLNTVDKYNAFISAKLPDKATYPCLYSMVVRHMMHGPCGDLNLTNVCTRSEKCKNRFPRPYTNETKVSKDGYPIYRRRNDNRKARVRRHTLDNRWIVPYNSYLLSLFD